MKDFFTSDPHFYHTNIIKHCNRPFANAEEMNAELIKRWNSKVKPGDRIFVMGDLFFGPVRSREQVEGILKQLNGNIVLIKGNHDGAWLRHFPKTESPFPMYQYRMEKIQGQPVFMCHYAMVNWDGSHHGTWLLYGHAHEDKIAYKPPNSLNVCMDLHNFYPLDFDEVKSIILSRQPKEAISGEDKSNESESVRTDTQCAG